MVTVWFSPTTDGGYSDTLTVTTSSPIGPSSIDVGLSGVGGRPTL